MKIADQCIICNQKKITLSKAIVVPFIAERVFNRKAFRTYLISCENCGFQFYAVRLDDAELVRLYDGYRDDQYIRQRNRHEPWYTHKLNDRLFAKPATLNIRSKAIVDLVEHYEPGISNHFKKVVDYGGDKGQLLDGILDHAEKYVYEISNVDLLPGISKAVHPSPITFDFIICSNVFEHVSYPEELLKKMSQMAHQDTVVYLEIPNEQPFGAYTLAKRIVQQTLLLLLRPRQFMDTFGPGMLTHMHEHVNYFSEQSLHILLENIGFKDIDISVQTINQAKFFCCFAKKK
ncbi:MAG: class I SAM-dependent methyltransferase [Mariniphaga sp.]